MADHAGEESEAEGLRRAGRSVTGCIWEDCRLPDPAELLVVPAAEAEVDADVCGGLVRLSRVVVIPELVLAQYGPGARCFMGLASEIGRAWLTVDQRLYLWDVRAGRDVATYAVDAAAGPIIGVEVVRPRPGVFVAAVQHLLVVLTPAEIRLLGVELGATGDAVLHDTGLVFGTDGVNMLAAVGTAAGRLFVGGQDGHVYELEYGGAEGWFTRRCRKTNRTGSLLGGLAPTFLRARAARPQQAVTLLRADDRGLLYALTEGSRIDVYQTAQSWLHTGSTVLSAEAVQHVSPGLSRAAIGEKIIGIHPIGAGESARLRLVAVTVTGLRLYYDAELRLVHAQPAAPAAGLQPGPTRRAGPQFNLAHLSAALAQVHLSYAARGLLVTAGALSADEDVLTVRAAVPMHLAECAAEWRLDGKVWDVREAAPPAPPPAGPAGLSSWWAELVGGHAVPPRQLLCLTNAGSARASPRRCSPACL